MSRTVPLHVGVVGMGFGSSVHIPALQGIDGIAIVALADGGSGQAARVAAGIPGALAYSDPLAMVEAGDLDFLVVAVPPVGQEALVQRALAFGKAVLCEKPLGANAAQSIALARAADSVPQTTAINLQFRYDPGIRALKQHVELETVGRIRRIDVMWLTSGAVGPDRMWSWRNDIAQAGGIVSDFAIHVFDYLRWIVGAPITAISGRMLNHVAARPSAAGTMRSVTAPDEVDLVLQLGDQVAARMVVSNTYPDPFGHRVELHGDTGRLTLHHRWPFRADDRLLWLEIKGEHRPLPVPDAEPSGTDSRVHAVRRLIEDFLRKRRGEAAPNLPSFNDAAALQQVIEMVHSMSEEAL